MSNVTGRHSADSFIFSAAAQHRPEARRRPRARHTRQHAIPAHVVVPTGPGSVDGFMGTQAASARASTTSTSSPRGGHVRGQDRAGVRESSTVISYRSPSANNGPNPAINARWRTPSPREHFRLALLTGRLELRHTCCKRHGHRQLLNPSMASDRRSSRSMSTARPPRRQSATLNRLLFLGRRTPGNNSSTRIRMSSQPPISRYQTPQTGPFGTSSPLTYTISSFNAGPDPRPMSSSPTSCPAGTMFTSAIPRRAAAAERRPYLQPRHDRQRVVRHHHLDGHIASSRPVVEHSHCGNIELDRMRATTSHVDHQTVIPAATSCTSPMILLMLVMFWPWPASLRQRIRLMFRSAAAGTPHSGSALSQPLLFPILSANRDPCERWPDPCQPLIIAMTALPNILAASRNRR